MKSVNVLIASAGIAAAQTITADIASISSAVAVLNSQVSAFSDASQASAIVDSSNNIVSIINQGTQDAMAEGSIDVTGASNLLTPFQDLEAIVRSAIDNLVSRKAVATSLSLGNVVEAQIESQLTAAQGFAAAVQSDLPAALAEVGSSLAGAILSDLSSGSSAFSGLSGPSTLGGGSSPGSTSVTSTAPSTSTPTGSSSSAPTSTAPSTSSTGVVVPPTNGTAPTGSSNVTVPTGPSTSTGGSSPTITPSSGAEKTLIGFGGVAAAALIAMLAL